MFIDALSNYLLFCREILKLPTPLKYIAGATKVEEYRMTALYGTSFGGKDFGGRVEEPYITYEGQIKSYDTKPTEILRPFFEHLWDELGLTRPDREQL